MSTTFREFLALKKSFNELSQSKQIESIQKIYGMENCVAPLEQAKLEYCRNLREASKSCGVSDDKLLLCLRSILTDIMGGFSIQALLKEKVPNIQKWKEFCIWIAQYIDLGLENEQTTLKRLIADISTIFVDSGYSDDERQRAAFLIEELVKRGYLGTFEYYIINHLEHIVETFATKDDGISNLIQKCNDLVAFKLAAQIFKGSIPNFDDSSSYAQYYMDLIGKSNFQSKQTLSRILNCYAIQNLSLNPLQVDAVVILTSFFPSSHGISSF